MTENNVKKRKVSKKNKSSWRKHIDTKDVDKFLEDSRLEERLGSFPDRKDSDLFVISTKPEIINKKTRRELLQSKEPRCFSILKPHSSVPDPITKRNRVKTKEERQNTLPRKKVVSTSEQIVTLKEKLRSQNRIIAAKRRLNNLKREEFKNDVWKTNFGANIDTNWMSLDTTRHTLTQFGVKNTKLPISLRRKCSVPAIEVPHPGTSYNPSFQDHQDLLQEVAQSELKLIKEEKHLERVTTNMFRKVSPKEKENSFMQELAEGLKLDDKEDLNVDDDPVAESLTLPVKNLKKTHVQRRKQKEQKALAHKKQLETIEKKKIADIYKLKLLNKKLAAKERKEKILREKRLKKRALKLVGPKTLSNVKFEPIEPDFKLAEELTGSLRNSEPTGSLLMDRYKSFQQRNIVAPSTRRLKRDKAKVKRFIKPDHKIDMKLVKQAQSQV